MSTASQFSATRLAAASIAVGILVLGIKFLAWGLTGSVALFSDALESVVNVGAACAALYAIHLSQQPADENHPYGHHKVEYLSAVLEGALIVIAAFLILREAIGGLMNPQLMDAPWLGLAVNALAGAVNAGWALVLIRYGRRHRSPALTADGKHLAADTVTTIGVLFGLTLSVLTGWAILDPLLAAAVACNVIWSGWGLIRESVGGLMDAAPPQDELERIRAAIAGSAHGAIEAHDLRARHAGRRTFVDFHLVVPEDMNVADAHVICDRIERAVRKTVGEALISIHVEPEHKSKHHGELASDPAAILIEGHEALRTYH